jgi:hypothetical protein
MVWPNAFRRGVLVRTGEPPRIEYRVKILLETHEGIGFDMEDFAVNRRLTPLTLTRTRPRHLHGRSSSFWNLRRSGASV